MMNFELTEEQQSVKKVVRKYVDKEIIPYIQEWDRQGEFQPHILKKVSGIAVNGRLYPRRVWWSRNGL